MSYADHYHPDYVVGPQPMYYGGEPEGEQDEAYYAAEAQVGAPVAAPQQQVVVADPTSHLRTDDLYGVQNKVLVIDMCASPEELARAPHKAQWKIASDNLLTLKHVTSTVNRHRASPEELRGRLEQAVLLHAKVLSQRNEAPYPVGINITGIMPNFTTANGRFSWVVDQQTPTMAVNETVFEPTSLFSRHTYRTLQRVNTASLARQIVYPQGDPENAIIRTDGPVMEVLADNLAEGRWRGHEEILVRAAGAPYVDIPSHIARELQAGIEEELKPLEDSFVNMNDFTATFARADGQPWNHHAGLVGQIVTSNGQADDQLDRRAAQLNTRYSTRIMLQVSYILQ